VLFLFISPACLVVQSRLHGADDASQPRLFENGPFYLAASRLCVSFFVVFVSFPPRRIYDLVLLRIGFQFESSISVYPRSSVVPFVWSGERLAQSRVAPLMSEKTKTVVVIGNGMVSRALQSSWMPMRG